MFNERDILVGSVVNDLVLEVTLVLQCWLAIKPGLTLLPGQTPGTFRKDRSQIPDEVSCLVNVVVRERKTGHDPVYPAHTACCIAVHRGDLIAAANPPGHGTNL